MRDNDQMASALSTQLDFLHRERDRLEQLLMLDANWRTLLALDEADDAACSKLRPGLTQALAGNRIYAAREKLLETIALLEAETPAHPNGGASPLSSRIMMLSDSGAEMFRARIRMKPPTPSSSVADTAPRVPPDDLELIDGLGRTAVEQLLDGGVVHFSDIARWNSEDVRRWRKRLDGLAEGTPASWIEQAALLATGTPTHHARRVRRGELAALVPSPGPTAVVTQAATAGAAPGRDPAPSISSLVETPNVPARGKRLVTAEELIRLLDPGRQAEPAAVSSLSPRRIVGGHPPLPASPRDGFDVGLQRVAGAARKEPADASARFADTSDDVVVIARGPVSDQPQRPRRSGHQRAQRLLERLKQAREPDRFEAAGYAAYRSSIEEASVTIVRPDTAAPSPSNDPAQPRPEPMQKPAGVMRFLRALTGKG